MSINLKTTIGTLIQLLTVLSTVTASTIDDKILGLLKALYASDAFLAVLQAWIDKLGGSGIPEGALGLTQFNANDPAWADAYNQSPALQAWATAQPKPNVADIPKDAQAFLGIGTLLTVLMNIPTIIALLKALLGGTFGKIE